MNCPLGIDLPALILNAKHAGFRLLLSDRLLAQAGPLQGLGSQAAGVVNPVLQNRGLRWAVEKTLNISRQRQLPLYRRQTFARWFNSRANSFTSGGRELK